MNKNSRTANFIVRGWRNWIKKRFNNLQLCVTTNAYQCLELNAHSLILFLQECRDNNCPEQFIVAVLSSQPNEKIFRQLRSMGTTQQTVINFTAKELTEKLKRIHTKMQIMYKHKDSINFPSVTRLQKHQCEVPVLPSDEMIISTVEKAQDIARETLIEMGIEYKDINMADSINIRGSEPLDTEFVNVEDGDYFVEDIDESEVPRRICNEDEQENEQYEDEDEIVNGSGNEDQANDETMQHNDPIYNATELFPNCNGGLNLKSSTVGEKYCFKIRDVNGSIKLVKKSTFLWMITRGKYRLSSDRLRRFCQKECV